MASVSERTRKSPSLELRNIQVSPGWACVSVYDLMAWPTRPDPPVIRMVDLGFPDASCLVIVVLVLWLGTFGCLLFMVEVWKNNE